MRTQLKSHQQCNFSKGEYEVFPLEKNIYYYTETGAIFDPLDLPDHFIQLLVASTLLQDIADQENNPDLNDFTLIFKKNKGN